MLGTEYIEKSIISVMTKKLKLFLLLGLLQTCKGIQIEELEIGCSCDIDIFTPESQGCMEVIYVEDDMVKTGHKCINISQVSDFCQIYQAQYQRLLTCSLVDLETFRKTDAALSELKYVSPSSRNSESLKVSTKTSHLIVETPSYYYNLNYTTLDPLKPTTPTEAWLEKPSVETYDDYDEEIGYADDELEADSAVDPDDYSMTETDPTTNDPTDSTTEISTTISSTNSPSTESSSTNSPSTESPSTNSPSPESSSTNGPSTESSSTKSPSTKSSSTAKPITTASTHRTPRPFPNGAVLISSNVIIRVICFGGLLSPISAKWI